MNWWPFRSRPEPTTDLPLSLASLTARVRTLEAERLELLTEWTKTRDQVIRYMKRAGALRGRQTEPLDDLEPEDSEGDDLDVIRAKFGALRSTNGS